MYFEVVSTLALVMGLIVVTIVKPGSGFTMNAADLDVKAVAAYATASQSLSTTDFLLNIIPNTVVDAFARGEVLQVLLFSVLFGLALVTLGRPARPLVALLEHVSHALFAIIDMLMRMAPIGAFGAMAFTIGRYGIGSLVSLGQLMLAVYGTCALFIFVVLGAIARLAGFSLWKLLRYIREEILIVAGTASSETVLPRIMEKMERLGCRDRWSASSSRPGIPSISTAGHLHDMATVFLAQVSAVHMSLAQTLSILEAAPDVEGAAAVSGGGFITLAATPRPFTDSDCRAALLLGVDRFMAGARALTNLIGNAVATVIAH